MATMTIRITVQAKGITWSRTASVEVDTAQFQQGTNNNAPLFGSEGTSGVVGQHSYSGIAVGVFANKAKGSVIGLLFNTSSTALGGPYIQTSVPFILYSGAGGGMTGAMNASGTGTDLPDEDVNQVTMSGLMGSFSTHCLAGLKTIS